MIKLYTDGAAKGNPGPGGYAGMLIHPNKTKEYSGAYQHTTNNRMELLAIIIGLEQLKKLQQHITIYSDSRYVVDAIQKGWLKKWQQKQFNKTKNTDLWQRFLRSYNKHNITLQWIKAHAGNPYNERCDQLAVYASNHGPWMIDTGYQQPTNNQTL